MILYRTIMAESHNILYFVKNSFCITLIMEFDEIKNREPHIKYWKGLRMIDKQLRPYKITFLSQSLKTTFHAKVNEALKVIHSQYSKDIEPPKTLSEFADMDVSTIFTR